MTKKDYELIASAFNISWLVDHYPHHDSLRTARRKSFDSAVNESVQTARRLAKKLAEENAKFDTVRFLRDCGMSDNQLMSYNHIERTLEYNVYSVV